jgi:probable HAF family extracellular repeat protein
MIVRLAKKFLLGLVAVVVIATGLSVFTTTLATTRFWYTVTDLGTLGGNSYASDINDAEQVVGWYDSSSWSEHGFFWQNGEMTDIAAICSPIPFPPRINNSGQIAGNCNTDAVLWENKTTTNLNLTYAYDINDRGKVVGMLDRRPVVLDKQGRITDLGSLGGFIGNVQGINNRGQIVAVASDTNLEEQNTFLWNNGDLTDLGKLFYVSPLPPARINNSRQIVGTLSAQQGQIALLWQNGQVIDLGSLGGGNSYAHDINQAGKVVGSSSTSSGVTHPFVWSNGRMRDLNNLSFPKSRWELQVALGINNKGQIVGYGTHNGKIRAFLLTPRWVIQ